MSTKLCVLLLGSNVGDKNFYLNEAIKQIQTKIGEICRVSNRLETAPVGFISESIFLNQKIEVKTHLSPIKLLEQIKFIEKMIGRTKRKPKDGQLYADREIDIDILYYERIQYQSIVLTIPHKEIINRNFLLDLKFL